MSLVRATRSELTKQFTTPIWWILALVLFVYVGTTAAALGFVFAAAASGSLPGNAPDLPAEGLAPVLYSLAASIGYVFPVLLGTLMVTSEFRYKTLTPSFLATPRRGILLVAKAAVGASFGVFYGVIAIVAAVGLGAALLSAFALDTQLSAGDTWAQIGRTVIAFVLWVLLGIGVGAVVRNQVGAIVGVLAFTQFVEPIGRVAATFVQELSGVTNFLPGSASDALVGASIFTSALTGGSTSTSLEWWAGGLVLLGYAAVLLVIGYATSWRRDVT